MKSLKKAKNTSEQQRSQSLLQDKLTNAFLLLGKKFAEAKSPYEVGRIALEEAESMFGWDAAYLNLYSEDEDLVYSVVTFDTVDGKQEEYRNEFEGSAPSPITRLVLEKGAQRFGEDDWERLRVMGTSPFGDTGRFSRSMLFAPVRSREKKVAILSIQSYDPDIYSEEHLRIFQSLADYCGGALDRTYAEYSLRQSEELFRLVSEQIPSVLWTVNDQFEFTMVSGRGLSPLSIKADRLRGSSLNDFVEKYRVRGPLLDKHNLAIEGIAGSYEMSIGERVFHCHIEPFWGPDGQQIGCLQVAHDITTNKKAEVELRRSREQLEQMINERTQDLQNALSLLRATLEATTDGIIVTDIYGRIVDHNQIAQRMLDINHRSGRDLRRLISSLLVIPDRFEEAFRLLERNEGAETSELLDLKDGRILECNSKPQKMDDTFHGRVWSFRDITRRHQAEERLAKSEAIYRQAIENADGVTYRRYLGDRGYDFVSSGIEDVLEISPEQFSRDEFVRLIYETEMIGKGDFNTLEEYEEAFIEGRVSQYRLDHRVFTPTGKEKWITDSAIPLRDEITGKVIGSLGIIQDITVRKRTELEAREQQASEVKELQSENEFLKKQLLQKSENIHPAFTDIITKNDKMHLIFRYIESIAPSDQVVLIQGETGVGKEMMARAVHEVSEREGEFVPVNVAGLDDDIFTDTLFGHKRGSFTGAATERKGLVETAREGTLFLDEIGDLNPSSQVKLLRLLQEREFYQIGSDKPSQSTARIIVATNKDLDEVIKDGRFRQDLFYRLQTHRIIVPPLRQRPEDIPPLLDHFIERAAESLGKKKPTVPQELYNLLQTYYFPGNVRELQSIVFDAVSKHTSRMMSMKVFQERIRESQEEERRSVNGDGETLQSVPVRFSDERLPTIKEATELLIQEALARASENQSLASQLLGISQQALSQRLKRQKNSQ